jgi:hypothetical protein
MKFTIDATTIKQIVAEYVANQLSQSALVVKVDLKVATASAIIDTPALRFSIDTAELKRIIGLYWKFRLDLDKDDPIKVTIVHGVKERKSFSATVLS